MAPLVEIAIQWLLGSAATNKLSSPIRAGSNHVVENIDGRTPFAGIQLSSVSWGLKRNDVFGTGHDGDVTHKYWDGYQWRPSSTDVESLGGEFAVPPTAVSWGPDRVDIFSVGDDENLYHKYWDGGRWQPYGKDWETLGENISTSHPLAVTAWSPNRLDIFAIVPSESGEDTLSHKYWDGSSWRPEGSALEPLRAGVISGPAAVSWGKNRNDVFVLGEDGALLHSYWDGSNWAAWESFGGDFVDVPTAISWGENRLDLFGIHSENSKLYHKYWDGSQWSDWEDFGGQFAGTVAATSWGPNRIDIVGWGRDDQQYYYKYWDGSQWNPSGKEWSSKKGNFASAPSVVSWGKDRLDIYGVGGLGSSQLTHQTWYGSGWYPGFDAWEELGGPVLSEDSTEQVELK